LLAAFLEESPNGVDTLLEPLVYSRIVRQNFSDAAAILDQAAPSLRSDLLRAALHRAQGQLEKSIDIWQRHIKLVLDAIKEKLGETAAGDRVGWDHADDATVLREVMAELAPECDTGVLNTVQHAVWPDMDAFPDFSADMAWLANALGELADSTGASADSSRIARCATLLGYPHRLQRHLQRDELWFWSKEPAE